MTSSSLPRLLLAASLALLAACGSTKQQAQRSRFDLGPVETAAPAGLPERARVQASVLGAISVADVAVPEWLDSTAMHYRLLYGDRRLVQPYAYHQWTMTPADLIGQRLKWRIAQAGGAVLTTGDSRALVLRVEADDFSQSFDSPASSRAQVALRATVLAGRRLVGQRTFVRTAPAGANAAAGAEALALATDEAIAEMLGWLAAIPAAAAGTQASAAPSPTAH